MAGLSVGLPRVINIVCDRALEAAYAQRTRTIDLETINAAARALGMPVQSAPAAASAQTVAAAPGAVSAKESPKLLDFFPPLAELDASTPSTVEQPDTPYKHVPVALRNLALKDASFLSRTWLMPALSVVLAIVVIWLGVRAMNRPAPPVTAPTAPPPRSSAAVPPSSTTSASAPADPAPPAAIGTATTPAVPAAASPTDPATSTGERFEIAVASFRTDERATVVARQVTALGLPNRRRQLDGWQQVIAGPFATRAEATTAQQRLERAGLGATTIMPMER